MEPTAAFAKIFEIAEKQLGIPQILDPADLLDGGADECRYFLEEGRGKRYKPLLTLTLV